MKIGDKLICINNVINYHITMPMPFTIGKAYIIKYIKSNSVFNYYTLISDKGDSYNIGDDNSYFIPVAEHLQKQRNDKITKLLYESRR